MAFSLKLSTRGTMADTATLLWVDFNDSATFIISVAISASGLFKEGSFAPAWKKSGSKSRFVGFIYHILPFSCCENSCFHYKFVIDEMC